MRHSRKKSIQSKKTANNAAEQIDIDYDDPIKPDDQLILSPEELDEQYGNILHIKEPPKQQARLIYSIKNKKFVRLVDRATFITLIDLKSSLLSYDSADAQVQTANKLCRIPEVVEIKRKESMVDTIDEEDKEHMDFENNKVYKNITEFEEVGEEFQLEEDEMIGEMSEIGENSVLSTIRDVDAPEQEKELDEVSEQSIKSLPIKPYCAVVKLKNKFNFFNRYTKTKDIDTRDAITETTTTIKVPFRTFVSLTDIYEAYCENVAIQEAERQKEMKKKMAAHILKKKSSDDVENFSFTQDQRKYNLLNISKTSEKIISFNETEAIAQDFRYYEDPSDQYRDKGEGTLMIMWSMLFKKEKVLIVTDISWSPDYFDLFGVTFSISLSSIISQTENSDVGYVCLWSLKNSSYPQIVNQTQSGATCLCFHPDHGHVYVVGMRDGSLAVYNMSLLIDEPQYKTDVNDPKHISSVKQVVWREDLSSGHLNFYSISDDGTVCQWILLQNEMVKIVKLSLTIDMHPELEFDGLKQTYNAIATTITFNPKDSENFLIGTNEGYIFKCNTEWHSYVQRFRAHKAKINQIDYNKFNTDIYITCSEDFTVKLWDETSEVPLMLINLKTCLPDVRWSPFSSTVFCAITDKCRAIFYDLDVNLRKPVCDQLVQSPDSSYRLIKLAFDRRVPLIVIGSFNGTVLSYKLSPNLHTIMKSPKKGIQVPTETLELEKLSTVLQSIMREIN